MTLGLPTAHGTASCLLCVPVAGTRSPGADAFGVGGSGGGGGGGLKRMHVNHRAPKARVTARHVPRNTCRHPSPFNDYKRGSNSPAPPPEHKSTWKYSYTNTLTPILILPAACPKLQTTFRIGLGLVPPTHSMHSTQVGSFISFVGVQGPCSFPLCVTDNQLEKHNRVPKLPFISIN